MGGGANNFFMIAAFCQDPKSHVGQPVAFDVSDEEDDVQIAPEEYVWEAGVSNSTPLRLFL